MGHTILKSYFLKYASRAKSVSLFSSSHYYYTFIKLSNSLLGLTIMGMVKTRKKQYRFQPACKTSRQCDRISRVSKP